MRAWQLANAFGLENLALIDLPDPGAPGPGQVRVRLEAASLNYRDLLMVRGFYNPRQPLPLIPCSDGAGVVEAVGPGVTRAAVGDLVALTFVQGWVAGEPTRELLGRTLGGPLDGTLREVVVLDESGVVRAPRGYSAIEAATLPCAALTAWSALHTWGALMPGQTVLVLGTGGVSVFALQLARAAGARVIVTSSSDDKLQRALHMGAHATINYRTTPDWAREAVKLTGGRGVDLVVEVGGAGTFDQSVRALRPGGNMALIGVLAGPAEVNLTRVLMANIRVQGIIVGHREGFEQLVRAVELHQIRPVVDAVYPMASLPKAFDALAGQGHFGKIAIDLTAA